MFRVAVTCAACGTEENIIRGQPPATIISRVANVPVDLQVPVHSWLHIETVLPLLLPVQTNTHVHHSSCCFNDDVSVWVAPASQKPSFRKEEPSLKQCFYIYKHLQNHHLPDSIATLWKDFHWWHLVYVWICFHQVKSLDRTPEVKIGGWILCSSISDYLNNYYWFIDLQNHINNAHTSVKKHSSSRAKSNLAFLPKIASRSLWSEQASSSWIPHESRRERFVKSRRAGTPSPLNTAVHVTACASVAFARFRQTPPSSGRRRTSVKRCCFFVLAVPANDGQRLVDQLRDSGPVAGAGLHVLTPPRDCSSLSSVRQKRNQGIAFGKNVWLACHEDYWSCVSSSRRTDFFVNFLCLSKAFFVVQREGNGEYVGCANQLFAHGGKLSLSTNVDHFEKKAVATTWTSRVAQVQVVTGRLVVTGYGSTKATGHQARLSRQRSAQKHQKTRTVTSEAKAASTRHYFGAKDTSQTKKEHFSNEKQQRRKRGLSICSPAVCQLSFSVWRRDLFWKFIAKCGPFMDLVDSGLAWWTIKFCVRSRQRIVQDSNEMLRGNAPGNRFRSYRASSVVQGGNDCTFYEPPVVTAFENIPSSRSTIVIRLNISFRDTYSHTCSPVDLLMVRRFYTPMRFLLFQDISIVQHVQNRERLLNVRLISTPLRKNHWVGEREKNRERERERERERDLVIIDVTKFHQSLRWISPLGEGTWTRANNLSEQIVCSWRAKVILIMHWILYGWHMLHKLLLCWVFRKSLTSVCDPNWTDLCLLEPWLRRKTSPPFTLYLILSLYSLSNETKEVFFFFFFFCRRHWSREWTFIHCSGQDKISPRFQYVTRVLFAAILTSLQSKIVEWPELVFHHGDAAVLVGY